MILLPAILLACGSGPKGAGTCGPYVPAGRLVGVADDCEEATCPVLCAGSWCGASVDGIYCEACEDWESFKEADDCPECEIVEWRDAQSLDCDLVH